MVRLMMEASGDPDEHQPGDGHDHSTEGSYMWDLDAGFKTRLQEFIKASDGRVTLISGYRSNDHQQRLYDAAVAEHGADNAGRWAAPPGRSNHNHGLAGDLQYSDDVAKQWAHQNAGKFGLEFPMTHEPWHVEPSGLRDGKYEKEDFELDRQAYTLFDGHPHPMDLGQDSMSAFASTLELALSQPIDQAQHSGVGSEISTQSTSALEGEGSIIDG